MTRRRPDVAGRLFHMLTSRKSIATRLKLSRLLRPADQLAL